MMSPKSKSNTKDDMKSEEQIFVKLDCSQLKSFTSWKQLRVITNHITHQDSIECHIQEKEYYQRSMQPSMIKCVKDSYYWQGNNSNVTQKKHDVIFPMSYYSLHLSIKYSCILMSYTIHDACCKEHKNSASQVASNCRTYHRETFSLLRSKTIKLFISLLLLAS